MQYIKSYSLNDVFDDLKYLDNTLIQDYVASLVYVMREHYEKEYFDNEIIKQSEEKNLTVMDFIIDSYKN